MRRTATVTIDKSGRDCGKVFHITEMSAIQAEKWAARVLIALAKSGVDVPDNVTSAGLAGLAVASASAVKAQVSGEDVSAADRAKMLAGVAVFVLRAIGGMDWSLAEPLLDEMMGCVKIIRDPSNPRVPPMPLLKDADDIEEVSTLLVLRREILELHLGFSLAEHLSASTAKSAESNTSTTPTSPKL